VPLVTIRMLVDGREEVLEEYLCDWPACQNVAVYVVGVICELGARSAMCAEHAVKFVNRNDDARP